MDLPAVMRELVAAFEEIRATSLPDVELVVEGQPGPFDPERMKMGACISLTNAAESWVLVIVGDQPACDAMTRSLFCMEPDEEIGADEHADALGEIANMTGGLLKRKTAEVEGQSIRLGLPLYVVGSDAIEYAGKKYRLLSQRLCGAGELAQLVLFCQT